MIKIEYLTINGKVFAKTYSTDNLKIRKVGTAEIYEEAIDPIAAVKVYEETAEKIEEGI